MSNFLIPSHKWEPINVCQNDDNTSTERFQTFESRHSKCIGLNMLEWLKVCDDCIRSGLKVTIFVLKIHELRHKIENVDHVHFVHLRSVSCDIQNIL